LFDLRLLFSSSRKSNKDRQHNGQKFEDTKELSRNRKSNKNRQRNGQKFEDTKEKTEAVNQTRIDNTMAKSLKKLLNFLFAMKVSFYFFKRFKYLQTMRKLYPN
jgi:hypothetical protein